MSLSDSHEPDASNALIHDALCRAEDILRSSGVNIESLLIVVVHDDDGGIPTSSTRYGGSVFSAVGAAQTWINDHSCVRR